MAIDPLGALGRSLALYHLVPILRLSHQEVILSGYGSMPSSLSTLAECALFARCYVEEWLSGPNNERVTSNRPQLTSSPRSVLENPRHSKKP